MQRIADALFAPGGSLLERVAPEGHDALQLFLLPVLYTVLFYTVVFWAVLGLWAWWRAGSKLHGPHAENSGK